MKILLAGCNKLNAKHDNPYVRTLVEGINAQYNDVEWGDDSESFWNDDILKFDIVHIQWPSFVFRTVYYPEKLEQRLKLIKARGIKIVTTCHNLEPHYAKIEGEKQCYNIAYSLSDCILHLGNYSLELFRQKYPNVRHELLLHHVYDKVYPKIPTFNESLKKLHLSSKFRYVLCFGNFRADEERQMIINLSRRLAKDNIRILAPSFFRVPIRKNFFIVAGKYLRYLLYKLQCPNIVTTPHFVDDDNLPYWYGASSISLIQRLKILNSGSVSLGFYMKNCVVGPDLGNVGPWLLQTGNPVFKPNDDDSLYEAVKKAFSLPFQGEKNHQYAISHLTSQIQSKRLYEIYKSL
jgi:glycosyltransferase involved in cell wall biosynthesis